MRAGPDKTGLSLAAARDRGDEAEMREFYDEHLATVHRYVACRVDRDPGLVEEVVEEVFFQAFRDAEQFDGKRSLRAWLLGIARHRVLDACRRRRRRPALERAFGGLDEEVAARLAELERGDLPDGVVEHEEIASLVEIVLSGMPPAYEEVLRMHYLEGLAVKEIAEDRATSAKAIESRLYRARIAFRDAFKAAGRNLRYQGSGNV